MRGTASMVKHFHKSATGLFNDSHGLAAYDAVPVQEGLFPVHFLLPNGLLSW